ncbi:MAG: hypothetical protein LBI13_00950 [Streptococcaceae bacterium]|jgi:hypothetical protein|nr:hypothetical protein [Streptococcaceae bacterium]
MKKKISILAVLGFLILLGLAFYLFQSASVNPQKNLGVEKIVDNKSGQMSITIPKSGYYDVTVSTADANLVGTNIPENGHTLVGTYYQKEQEIQIFTNAQIKFFPAKFERLEAPISLKTNGNYLVGAQFPAGDYQLTLYGNSGTISTKMGTVSALSDIYVFTPKSNGGETGVKTYELTNDKREVNISLKTGEMLNVKMPYTVTIGLKKL